MIDHSLTFIGGGNMARALIGGALAAGTAPNQITVVDPGDAARTDCQKQFGVRAIERIDTGSAQADVVVLAVKPQVMDSALAALAPLRGADTVVISVAAGVTLKRLAAGLGNDCPLVRAMPNTPALFGAGISGLVASPGCSERQREAANAVLAAAGQCVWLDDEALMDSVTAVSGSGPAYFFRFVEALAEAGERAGLPTDIARQLARQTAVGAGEMLRHSPLEAGELRRQVTSPGGTTQAALEQFERDGLATIIDKAVSAAVQRGRELGEN
ncbi:MAG: pyrroline-5-carboxylate reductase [Wenzhouxiangella sp.]